MCPPALVRAAIADPTNPSRHGGSREWYLDSGASRHICDLPDQMTDYKSIAPMRVTGLGNHPLYAIGEGNLSLWLTMQGEPSTPIVIRDVLCVPGAMCNLLAVKLLAKAGYRVLFEGDYAVLQDSATGKTWGRISLRDGNDLYRFETKPRIMGPISALATTAAFVSATSAHLWHDRLGHLGQQQMSTMRTSGMAEGAQLIPAIPKELSCDSCQVGKSHRAAMPRAATQRASRRLELVHSDVCGPINKVDALGGLSMC